MTEGATMFDILKSEIRILNSDLSAVLKTLANHSEARALYPPLSGLVNIFTR